MEVDKDKAKQEGEQKTFFAPAVARSGEGEVMYKCHICGAPLDHPGSCPECGESPVYSWMEDEELKKETAEKQDTAESEK